MREATIAYFVQLAVEITVSGRLTDGTRFEGSDMIRVIEQEKANKFKKLR